MSGRPTAGSDGASPRDQLRRVLARTHLHGLARALHWTLRRAWARVAAAADRLARAPGVGPAFYALARRRGAADTLYVGPVEVTRVVRSLERAGVACWLAGGWGLDALVGSETRWHADVDVVIDPFDENRAPADRALAALGYRARRPLDGTPWFPDALVYEDASGHRIEVLSVGDGLRRGAAPPGRGGAGARGGSPDEVAREDVDGELVADGRVGGAEVQALSLGAHRFILSNWPVRPRDVHSRELVELLDRRRGRAAGPPQGSDEGAGRDRGLSLVAPLTGLGEPLARAARFYGDDTVAMAHVVLARDVLTRDAADGDALRALRSTARSLGPVRLDVEGVRVQPSGEVRGALADTTALRALRTRLVASTTKGVGVGDDLDVVLARCASVAHARLLARVVARSLPVPAWIEACWLVTREADTGRWVLVEVLELAHGRRSDVVPPAGPGGDLDREAPPGDSVVVP